jgi:hypothetical protein
MSQSANARTGFVTRAVVCANAALQRRRARPSKFPSTPRPQASAGSPDWKRLPDLATDPATSTPWSRCRHSLPNRGRFDDRERNQRPAPARRNCSITQPPRHDQPPQRERARHRIKRREKSIEQEFGIEIIGASLRTDRGEKGVRLLIVIADGLTSNGAAPPAKCRRWGRVTKKSTAHSTPLATRSAITSHPGGNRPICLSLIADFDFSA